MASVVKKLLPGAAGTAGSGGGDDDFNFITSLYHFNGSNAAQNSTFLDSSGNNLTVTAGSDVPIQGTFSPFSADEGKWSVFMDGGNEYLEIDSFAGLGFGTGAYTIEMWVWKRATGQENLYDGRDGGTSNRLLFYVNGSNKLAVYENGSVTGTSSGDFPLNQWVHIALSRESGGDTRFWMNGAYQGGWNSSVNFAQPTNDLYVGRAYNSGSYNFGGYMSNLRVVKGTAVYTGTSAITVPTSPLTAITNTVLLTASSNTGQDRSTTGATICRCPVANGARVLPFSPFKNSASYDPAVHGGSFVFQQNTNSSLSVSHNTLFDFGTADYCLEAWLYPTQGSFNTSWAMWASTTNATQYWAYTDGGGNQAAAGFSAYPAGGYSGNNNHILRPHAWHHCVFQNTGGYENWYLNGTRIYNVQNNPNYSVGAAGMMFGRASGYPGNYFYGGYLSDVRVTTGTNYNPYSNASTLTVPTAPLTSGSYTRLLLSGTNAGIIDSSGKGNIEVYGNTQLNTSVKKFGTASGKFDESGDYLVLGPNGYNEQFNLGTGPFTIEGWVYFNSSPTDGQGLFQFDNNVLNNSNGRGPALGTYSGTGKWHRYWGQVGDAARYDGVGDAAATPAATTWIHFAYVKDTSDVIKVYIDGTQIGNSITYSSDYGDNTTLTIGGYYSSSYLLNGYIDDFRITLKARYTSNFTVPDVEHPDI